MLRVPGSQVEWLEALSPWPEEFGLGRMHSLLASLEHPEKSLRAIHVVGTNGKSTTTRMIEALLLAVGSQAGSFVSPHVESWSERIRVGGKEVDLERALARVRPAAERLGATQFEALAAAALAEFADAGVTVAVVEAGLGGRLDATNVLAAPMVVLTNVALEHVDVLGHSREAIAREKLAVVYPGATVVLGEPEWESLARSNGAANVVCASGNAELARAAAESFLGHIVDPAPLAAVSLPGRLESRGADPLELWDGAHNPEGVRHLVAHLPDRAYTLVASILADKDADEMLRLFAGVADHLVATASTNPRAQAPAELARRGEPFFARVEAVRDPVEALARARVLAGTEGAVLVSGSLYLLADLAAVRSRRLPWDESANA